MYKFLDKGIQALIYISLMLLPLAVWKIFDILGIVISLLQQHVTFH